MSKESSDLYKEWCATKALPVAGWPRGCGLLERISITPEHELGFAYFLESATFAIVFLPRGTEPLIGEIEGRYASRLDDAFDRWFLRRSPKVSKYKSFGNYPMRYREIIVDAARLSSSMEVALLRTQKPGYAIQLFTISSVKGKRRGCSGEFEVKLSQEFTQAVRRFVKDDYPDLREFLDRYERAVDPAESWRCAVMLDSVDSQHPERCSSPVEEWYRCSQHLRQAYRRGEATRIPPQLMRCQRDFKTEFMPTFRQCENPRAPGSDECASHRDELPPWEPPIRVVSAGLPGLGKRR